MKNTRDKILNAARNLFNKQAYSNVTIRMIAKELQISSGNLNYHFKKKEEILEALYFEMVAEFDARVENLNKTEFDLETVYHDIKISMERMLYYSFFWTDLYNLLRANKKIKKHFQKVYEHRFNGYLFLFEQLAKKGIMHPFGTQNEAKLLIERMLAFSNTWIYNSSLYDKKINTKLIEEEANKLLSFLYPYLSKTAKLHFEELANN
ncbi:MAG: TetR/AcrR family transcriptional regulator [Chitinophagales bacterium]|nr:TetR/AcrR family transcriptional regulator [Chitinophagales bacterium]